MLGIIQKDMCELQIQTDRIQASVGQVSGVQANLKQVRFNVMETEWTLDLKFIPFPQGTLRVESK